MDISRYCLTLGSIASFLIALLHLALVFKPQWYRHFGADELVQMHEKGSPFTVLVTLGLALMFAVWGAYALSGAGVIRQLPLLRISLIAIGAIYTLRGLMLPSELFTLILRKIPTFLFVRAKMLGFYSLSAGL